MSLSLSFKPLPTLHACYSVPIEWSVVAGNTTARAQGGQIKLVFVSAQMSSVGTTTATSAVASRSTGSTTTSRLVTSTTARPSTASLTTSTPARPTSTASTTRIARRAVPTPLTKTVTTVPISYTSVGWPTIALPSGTYNLAAYLVPSANAAEALVGVQRGVHVVQGTETGCLVAAGASSSSSSSTSSSGTTSTFASAGAPTGPAVTDDPAARDSTRKGPLIGGIIGAILGLLLTAGLAYMFIRRRRGRRGASPRRWFRRDDVARDRGVGSAFGHDFGALGGGGAGMTTRERRVSAPMDVVRGSGFGSGAGQGEKEAEKMSVEGPGEAYGLVSVLARRNTDLSTGSAYAYPTSLQEEVSTIEYLASAPPPSQHHVDHTSPSDASYEYPTSHQSHGRNNSETSYTTGQSHIALLGGGGSGGAIHPSYDPPTDTGHPTNSFHRRTSGTPSTYPSQRRKSSIAGATAAAAGVERSGSVRRKPVPTVDALEDGGSSSLAAAGGGNDKQKSFVLDVEPAA